MKFLFLTSLIVSNFSAFAGCCPTSQGLCCGGTCQYSCSGNELEQIKKHLTSEKDKASTKEKEYQTDRFSLKA